LTKENCKDPRLTEVVQIAAPLAFPVSHNEAHSAFFLQSVMEKVLATADLAAKLHNSLLEFYGTHL
jgi:hypothetical protein